MSVHAFPKKTDALRRTAFRDDGVDMRSFLPAALEVLETPPSPLGRRVAYALTAIAIVAGAWSWIGKVDIVAVASGKLVSHVRTQIVQPVETGTVKRILVSNGTFVKAGTPLIEFDQTSAAAEDRKATEDLVAAQLDRLRLLSALDNHAFVRFDQVTGATAEEQSRAQSQLTNQLMQRASQIAELTQEKTQHSSERMVLQQTIEKLQKTLPLITEKSTIKIKAVEIGASSIVAKLESQQLVIETQSELDITRTKVLAVDAQIASLDQKIATIQSEFATTAHADLAKADDRIRSAQEALAKSHQRLRYATLDAPVDGTVQQLRVMGEGAVVTPAQQIMTIVPSDQSVEVEAVLDNRDVGFVHVGERVEIKIDAFPFTRYGLMRGEVLSVDQDAEATAVTGVPLQGSVRTSDDVDHVEGSERLRYTVHIKLTSAPLDIDGKPAHLLPGMSVKSEILTGKRRIIDFVLAPLAENFHDALRER